MVFKLSDHLKISFKNEKDKNVSLGLFALTFFAIFREGVEVVLFMYAILIQSSGLSISGSILGSIVALMIGYAIFVQGKRVPLKQFFNVTSILLIFVCAGLVAYGVHEFEEAFYTKDEQGSYNLNVDGVVSKRKLDEFRDNNRKLSSQLQDLESKYRHVDLDEYKNLKEKIETETTKGFVPETDIDKQVRPKDRKE